MKKKNRIPSLVFAILFFSLSIPKFYKREFIDGGFYLLAVVAFVSMYFVSNSKES